MIYPDLETENRMKRLFAAAWMHDPNNVFDAARTIESDEHIAYQVAMSWPNDYHVILFKRELQAARGPLASVPSKEEFAAQVYREITNMKDRKDKLAFMHFFAKLMGYTEETKGIAINLGGGPRVMPVPVAASDEQWEAAAMRHSRTLLAQHG